MHKFVVSDPTLYQFKMILLIAFNKHFDFGYLWFSTNIGEPTVGPLVHIFLISFLSIPEVLLWSGIKKGPPRKLKFPEDHKLITEMMKKNLNA